MEEVTWEVLHEGDKMLYGRRYMEDGTPKVLYEGGRYYMEDVTWEFYMKAGKGYMEDVMLKVLYEGISYVEDVIWRMYVESVI